MGSRFAALFLAALLTLLSLEACEQRAPLDKAAADKQVASVILPRGPISDRPWAGRACDPAKPAAGELACVDGVAISVEDYELIRGQYPPTVSSRRVVQAMVDAELLASAAGRLGLWGPWLKPTMRAAMARLWLHQVFESSHGVEQVAAVDVARAFRNPTIRVRYNRQTSYFATDAQMLCCTGDWHQCQVRDDVKACIKRLAPQARALHKLLLADPPRSAQEMASRVALMHGQFPDATSAQVQFYYDKSKSYEDQSGYDLMVKPFSLAVVALEPGEISEPILSPFGWHIVRLNRVEAALGGVPEDPDVRLDIARHILPFVRKRDFLDVLFARMAKIGVRIHYDRLTRSTP